MNETEKEDKLIIANIIKKAEKTYNQDILTYSNFLDPRLLKLCKIELKKRNLPFSILAPTEETEKVLLIFLPTYLKIENIDISEYISCIRIYIKKEQKLQHKDYMGAIYNSGVKQSSIGDIIVCEDGAIIMCTHQIAEYFKYNLTKVGNIDIRVEIEKITNCTFPKREYIDLNIIASSTRIDSIVSEISKISRSKACEKILSGEVFLNYEKVKSKSIEISSEDILSIKGIGKFKISSNISQNKKGNTVLNIKKYN
ncbi:MAG: YlmH/Sll1252 family protein [Clostridia bacterium]